MTIDSLLLDIRSHPEWAESEIRRLREENEAKDAEIAGLNMALGMLSEKYKAFKLFVKRQTDGLVAGLIKEEVAERQKEAKDG